MNNDWKRDESVTTHAVYYRGGRYDNKHGYVSQYAGEDRYNWQDIRGGHRLSSIETGAEAAMAACDASMALSDDEFNARAAAALIDDIMRFEERLIELQPNTTLLPGYHAGFEAGFTKARESVLAALGSE